MPDPNDLPSVTINVVDFPDPDDLTIAVLVRLELHGSVVVCDRAGRSFPSFVVTWWRGVYVVRGDMNLHLGTFASIEAAIRAGRVGPTSAKEGS